MISLGRLAVQSLRYRKLTLVLSVSSIALSVILLLGVERIRKQVHDSFSSTISGTDLIVGARTGNVSLLLSSVFHIGYANQNVSYESYEHIASMPEVAWSIPLSLGDSHRGYAVLGTTDVFFEHFRFGRDQALTAAGGDLSVQNMGAVLGARVAKDLGYGLGDALVVTHGMGEESFVEHEDEPFTVVGILKPTGTPVDRTIHVSLYTMGAIHEHFYNAEEAIHDPLEDALNALTEQEEESAHKGHHHTHEGETPETLTAVMLGLTSPGDILMMQRRLNTFEEEALTAILPVVTLMELWSVVGPVEKALLVISILVLIVAFAGMMTTLMTSLNERRREMAILRSVGARPRHIFRLIVQEAMGVTLGGILAGALLLQLLILILSPAISGRFGIHMNPGWFSSVELAMMGIILLGGLLIGILPAYRSYRNSLTDGLTIKI